MSYSGEENSQTNKNQPESVMARIVSTRWLVRAAVIFWLGYLLMLATRHSFHRLTNLFILLLVSLFLAFAIEPGVNKLERRGWRRGRATISIVLTVVVLATAFAALFGTLVASQVADLLQNSEKYVNESVSFVNDTFTKNTSMNLCRS